MLITEKIKSIVITIALLFMLGLGINAQAPHGYHPLQPVASGENVPSQKLSPGGCGQPGPPDPQEDYEPPEKYETPDNEVSS